LLFHDFTRPVLALADDWIEQEKHAEELVVLVCARIDALANLVSGRGSQRERFASFVSQYSGRRRELERVSVPNLYRYVALAYYTLAGTLEVPGRLHLVTQDELPFLRFSSTRACR
jgi:hypothetical protein